MTALDINAVRRILRENLMTASLMTSRDMVAWENRAFKPPDASRHTLWVREALLIAGERRTSTAFVMSIGQYWASVFCPSGGGTQEAEDLSKSIATVFEAGTNLTDGDGTVSVQLFRTERLGGRNDPGPTPAWYSIPVVINWRSFTAVN